jgi:hypothetical protein
MFAKINNIEIFVYDESSNPYTMIRIMPGGEPIRATLDAERLDNEGEYQVGS